MTRTLGNLAPYPPPLFPGSCSGCQWFNFQLPAQTDGNEKLDLVSKWVLGAFAAVAFYKSISEIRKRFCGGTHTGRVNPADGEELANRNDSNNNGYAEGGCILDTKITADVEITDQNVPGED